MPNKYDGALSRQKAWLEKHGNGQHYEDIRAIIHLVERASIELDGCGDECAKCESISDAWHADLNRAQVDESEDDHG